jgi:hypothetical protein
MPHLLPELSGQLALTLAEPTLVEDVEDASFEQLGILDGPSPVGFAHSRVTITDQPGLGFRFTETPPA